jgi:hypothetical protein
LREVREDFRINGQMNFDSGWEWGYWLSDVVAARAAWNPSLSTENLSNSKYEAKNDQWPAFANAISVFTSIYEEVEYQAFNISSRLTDLLVRLSQEQERLIIQGKVNASTPCPDIRKLSGFGYLSGSDTWIELPRMVGLPILQADKVRMKEKSDPLRVHVNPLLREMERSFTELANEMKSIYKDAQRSSSGNRLLSTAVMPASGSSTLLPEEDAHGTVESEDDSLIPNEAALRLLEEIMDCMQLLAMRASHVRMLYDSMDSTTAAEKAQLQRQSRSVIWSAAEIVSRREKSYRVPWQRIASWRENPTVYRYGYLWSVHTLYYWWRDQGLAEGGSLQSEHSPCYLNRIDASEVAVGWGRYTLELIRTIINWLVRLYMYMTYCFALTDLCGLLGLHHCFSPDIHLKWSIAFRLHRKDMSSLATYILSRANTYEADATR